MKILTLFRHAKSSWDYPELPDFERPLNARGRRDAPSMATRLKKLPPKPDLLLSSPALRALITARLAAEALGIAPEDVAVNARIYEASPEELLHVVRGLDDAHRHVILFGHNPGISAFANLLAECDFEDMPTAAAARIEFDVKTWADVDEESGQLKAFLYPKDKDT